MSKLSGINHIFFTGIGGIGMSGIAEILLQSGYQVSGSDRELSDITDYLITKGAKIYKGHDGDNLQNVDLLVYSSAIPENNPERTKARNLGITQIRRAEMLADIMENKYSIAIAGTHGKTTTAALCSQILIEAEIDPTVVVGGKLKNLRTNARLGKSDVFVTEADEFDRSFLALSARLAVLTSIEEDHLDCYKDLSDIKDAFLRFINNVYSDGKIICNIDDAGINDILDKITLPIITYGFSKEADYRIITSSFERNGSLFEIEYQGKNLGRFVLRVPGKHNILNALAAFIVALELKIPIEIIKDALYNFDGVERRFEIKGTVNNITIVDDYAHHPTEVAATIESAKSGWQKQVIVVFQPHLYSRTRDFFKEFTTALSNADKVILASIYQAREEPIPDVSSKLILEEAKKQGFTNFEYIEDMEFIADTLNDRLKPGDMVITMGAGNIWIVGEKLLSKLKGRNQGDPKN